MNAEPSPNHPDDVLRQSEFLFRALIENVQDVIAMLSADGTVLYASPGVRRYGREPADLVGQSITDLVHPEDRERCGQILADLAGRQGEAVQFQVRARDAAGHWRHKQVVLQNLLQSPVVRAIVANVHDVTELKTAQEELQRANEQLEERVEQRTAEWRASESKYRRLIEGLDVEYVFYSQSRDGRILYVSPSVQNVLGYTQAQIERDTFAPYFTDNPINQVSSDSFSEALAGNPPEHRECELRHADGSVRILEYMDVPVFDDHGQVVAVEGIARDVTARKQAEQALRELNAELERRIEERTADLKQLNLNLWDEIQRREGAEDEIRRSEQRFRSVVEDQTEFIVRWRPDGTRTFVNSSYCRYFGQTAEELIGQSFFPLICDAEDRQRVRELACSLTPERPTSSYEHRVYRPDGSVGWTQWNDRALFDEQGRLIEFQSVGRDVTAQRETEDKLRRQHEELAHVARVSVMGEMVAAIGHEVGQPLHAIATYATATQKALEAGRPDSVAKTLAWAEKIQTQATRAGEIIRRLRKFIRADRATADPLDVNDAVRQALSLTAATMRRFQVQVDANLADGLPMVLADPIQIEQVVINLLLNACEAMEATPPDSRWVAIRSELQGGNILASVCDAGGGMSEEALERVFHAFYTTKPAGTGIGLAISRRIIDEYNGRLWASRNEDRGMTFSFLLPVIGEKSELC